MAFDINNFVIDRVVRGVALSQKDDSVLFSINQMQNVSLNCASESTDAVDALGTPIATFYRAKSAEFSAENAIFDMQLMATQLGTKKKVASADSKLIAPSMETFTVGEKTWNDEVVVDKYPLKHTPTESTVMIDGVATKVINVKELYALNGDSTFSTKYVKGTNASATEFAISDGKIVLPTGIANGTEMFVMYEYETSEAVEVVNSAKEFPVGCKFVMEVLGCDVCDQTNLIYAYVIFNNFNLIN